MRVPLANLHTSKKLPRKPRGLKTSENKVAAVLSGLLDLGEAQTKRLFFLEVFSPCTPRLGRVVIPQFQLTQLK